MEKTVRENIMRHLAGAAMFCQFKGCDRVLDARHATHIARAHRAFTICADCTPKAREGIGPELWARCEVITWEQWTREADDAE